MYGIILLYNLINMGVIVENFKNGEENYLCAVNMGCIVLADLYLLYFVKWQMKRTIMKSSSSL